MEWTAIVQLAECHICDSRIMDLNFDYSYVLPYLIRYMTIHTPKILHLWQFQHTPNAVNIHSNKWQTDNEPSTDQKSDALADWTIKSMLKLKLMMQYIFFSSNNIYLKIHKYIFALLVISIHKIAGKAFSTKSTVMIL